LVINSAIVRTLGTVLQRVDSLMEHVVKSNWQIVTLQNEVSITNQKMEQMEKDMTKLRSEVSSGRINTTRGQLIFIR
jgi:flagellin-like hook-associated protein FlgL